MAEGRRSLEETWKALRKEGFELPAGRGRKPKLIDHHANRDRKGDPVDITFFKTGWDGTDLSNYTLPRRYLNRSGFEGVSFRNSDLNQSFLCWNDFIDCDFTDADLTCCDMRATVFRNCSFLRAKLVGADLRGSSFEGCDFTGAEVTGAHIDIDDDVPLTEEQSREVEYCDEGTQPKGG